MTKCDFSLTLSITLDCVKVILHMLNAMAHQREIKKKSKEYLIIGC